MFHPDYDAPPEKPASKTINASGRSFGPLQGTEDEGEALNTQFQARGIKPRIYRDEKATEAAIANLKSPSILHLATHGFYLDMPSKSGRGGPMGWMSADPTEDRLRDVDEYVNNQLPLRDRPMLAAGLALTSANAAGRGVVSVDETDGILTGLEVLSMDLRGTQLVTLSACQTALGDMTQGEGVYSLNRAFLEAGAQAVLSTLWSVDDQATAAFMKRFYQHYLNGQSPARPWP